MELINKLTQFEIGKRTLMAVLISCLTLVILGSISLAGFAVQQSQKANDLLLNQKQKVKINETPEPQKAIPKATKVVDNVTRPKSKKVYHLSSILSPKGLLKRGLTKQEIAVKRNVCEDYVKRFSEVAKTESKKYGVPSSIKLAQALVESDCGCSRLAKENNNHFGIKCFSKNCKKGHCSNFSDDSHKDFFRSYENAWESFRAHSLFLQKERYEGLKRYGLKEYKAWAKGLKEAGYATDKRYAEKLIRVIEELGLNKLDL